MATCADSYESEGRLFCENQTAICPTVPEQVGTFNR
jgi:hypothetical protein